MTERRRPGRPSGLGAATFRDAGAFFGATAFFEATTFLGAMTFFGEGAFLGATFAAGRTIFFVLAATLRLAGAFDLLLPFPVLRLAMIFSVRLPVRRHSLTGRLAYSSLISRSFSSCAK